MKGWIGVDLDGTLAFYDGWKGPDHIGEPIEPMVKRVKDWIASGTEVRIFTARACIKTQVAPIIEWCKTHLGFELIVTNEKDYGMIELWDDRCRQVVTNDGYPIV